MGEPSLSLWPTWEKATGSWRNCPQGDPALRVRLEEAEQGLDCVWSMWLPVCTVQSGLPVRTPGGCASCKSHQAEHHVGDSPGVSRAPLSVCPGPSTESCPA